MEERTRVRKCISVDADVVLMKMPKCDGLVNANECRKEMKQRRKKRNRKEK